MKKAIATPSRTKQILEKYENILENVMDRFNDNKSKYSIKDLLFVLIQCSIFGDFGLTKSKLCEIVSKGNTKITEYLGILKKINLCVDMQSGKYHYYKANLDELDKYEIK